MVSDRHRHCWLVLNNAIDGRIASTPLLGTQGTTSYNALQARTQGRFSDLTISLGYTFAKNLGFITPSSVQGGAAMPWLYRTYNYGPVTTDIKSNFEATAIYELPFGKGKRWASSGKMSPIVAAGRSVVCSAITRDYRLAWWLTTTSTQTVPTSLPIVMAHRYRPGVY